MNDRYRLFRRGWGTYYGEDSQTGQQFSLRTRDKAEAYRLVAARNEAVLNGCLLALGDLLREQR
jgi:hypothetical protein